jgi:hypothetical protein
MAEKMAQGKRDTGLGLAVVRETVENHWMFTRAATVSKPDGSGYKEAIKHGSVFTKKAGEDSPGNIEPASG